MNFKKTVAAVCFAALAGVSLSGCTSPVSNKTGGSFTDGDGSGYESGGADSSDLTQSAENTVGQPVEASEEVPEGATRITGKATITEAGDYYVDSEISGKKISIECEGVTLYLSGATLTNEKKVIESTCGLTVTLLGENTVANSNTDGSNAIDCAGNLVINGSGSLSLSSTKNGIKANSITIVGATLDIQSAKDGLHAEVEIYDSAESQPEPSYGDGGYVCLSGANLTVVSADDGIQADTFVYVTDDSTVDITAGGGAPATVSTSSSDSASGKGIKAGPIDWGAAATDLEWDGYLISIVNGSISVNSNDDAVHSDGNVEITGGNISVSTGDDGIHADYSLGITGGVIDIKKSYEGIEGTYIDIGGGEISVVASDDGINAAGGADSSGFGGMDGENAWGPGGNMGGGFGGGFGGNIRSASASSSSDSAAPYISISGGITEISAAGDGVDSNGNLYVSGGELYVSGPVNGADAAIDYDGTSSITGGTVIAVCKSGMTQNFGSSTQGSIMLTRSSQSSGAVTLKDSSGNALASYTPVKSYNVVIISCPELVKGSVYSISACGTTATVSLSSLIISKNF